MTLSVCSPEAGGDEPVRLLVSGNCTSVTINFKVNHVLAGMASQYLTQFMKIYFIIFPFDYKSLGRSDLSLSARVIAAWHPSCPLVPRLLFVYK